MVHTALACLTLTSLLAAWAPRAAARPVGAVDLARIVADATLVFVARVTAVELEGRDGDTGRYVARLEVLRTLKGEPGSDATEFRYSLDDGVDGYEGLSRNTVRLVFLASGVDGRLTFVDRDHPSLPALAVRPAAAGASLEFAVAELAAFVLSPRENDAYGDGRDAVEALASLDAAATLDALLACAKDVDNPNRFDALCALLSKNDLEALALAEPLLAGPIPPASELEYVGQGLTGIDDVRAVPALTRLLTSPNVAVRRGAAYALRSTGSAAAEPGLGKALYDADREVRYHGLMGLAMLADREETYAMAPSVQLYERDEATYLRFWRGWAKRYNPPRTPKPTPCAAPRRAAVSGALSDVDVEDGIAGRADSHPAERVVPLAEPIVAPERYLGRAVVRDVIVDGISTRVYDGGPSYVLSAHDRTTGASVGPESLVVIETWSEALRRELDDVHAGTAHGLEIELRRVGHGYSARIVEIHY